MPKAANTDDGPLLARGDRRRSLKIRRLAEARARIDDFLNRAPALEDAEYQHWEQALKVLLHELFGVRSYLLRFRRLTIRPVANRMNGDPFWYEDPSRAWQLGLREAARILDEALEEAAITDGAIEDATVPEIALHPVIVAKCSSLYEAGHYAEAVEKKDSRPCAIGSEL